MTIQTPTLKITKVIGDGVTKLFTFGFRCFSPDDVVVLRSDSSGIETALSSSDYTLSLSASGLGGSVTLKQPLAVGNVLVITRQVTVSQLLDLMNQGAYFAEDQEAALDKLTAICQDLDEQTKRTLKVPVTADKTPEQLIVEILAVASTANDYAKEAKEILDEALVVGEAVARNADSVSLMKSSVDASERVVTDLASQVNDYADELTMVAENLDAIKVVDTYESAIAALAADLRGFPLQEFDGGEITEYNIPMNGVGGVLRVCAENIDVIREVAESLKNASSLMELAETVDEIGSTDYVEIDKSGETGA